jgi:hypothetical protein
MAPKSPTSTLEGMESLLLASGAHVIKIYHSFTIRRDQVDRVHAC